MEQGPLLEAGQMSVSYGSRKFRTFSQEAVCRSYPGVVEIGTLHALIYFRFYVNIIHPFTPTFSEWAFSCGFPD
jgi:hypothetical protein